MLGGLQAWLTSSKVLCNTLKLKREPSCSWSNFTSEVSVIADNLGACEGQPGYLPSLERPSGA